MSERWVITPDGGRPLVLPLRQDGGAQVVSIATPSPARRVTYATRPEGATPTVREWENREVTLQVALVPPRDPWASSTHDFGAPAPQAEGDGDLPGWTGTVRRIGPGGNATLPMLSDLTAAVTAVATTGGVVRRVLDDDTWLDFDVLDGELIDGPSWDQAYYTARAMTITVKLTCAPFGRGRERLLGAGTLPTGQRLLTIGALAVPGDVNALARLEFSGASDPQRSLIYAIDQPVGETAAPDVQVACEKLLAPEGGTVSVAGSVASSCPVIANPSAAWRTLSLLRYSAGLEPLEITGNYRVFLRVRSSTSAGEFSETNGQGLRVRLRWAAGAREGGLSENAVATIPTGPWTLADLGQVNVPANAGTLDGTVEVAGPVPGAAWGDVLLFVPTERFATASASLTPSVTGIPSAVDSLTGSGTLAGSAAQLGGSWTSIGTGPAWTRTSNGASRSVTSGSGGAAVLPISTATATISSAAPVFSATEWWSTFALVVGNAAGIAALYSLSSSAPPGAWAAAAILTRYEGRDVFQTAGVGDRVATAKTGEVHTPAPQYRPSLDVRADGTAVASFNGQPPIILQLPAGPPQTGLLAGFFSLALNNVNPNTVVVRDFSITSAVAPDAVLFPGRTAEVTSDRATRTTAAGLSGSLSAYRGDRPLLPPSGRAHRPTRVVLGTSGGDFRDGRETPLRPFTGRVFATPRYLQIPDENA